MSDIVERLRDKSGSHINGLYDNEAATEIERLRAALAAARAEALEEAAKVCEAYVHSVPDQGGDALDRIGRYSNASVRRCAAAIRALNPCTSSDAVDAQDALARLPPL